MATKAGMSRDPPNGEGLPRRVHLPAPSVRDQDPAVVREVDPVQAPGLVLALGRDQDPGLDRDLVRCVQDPVRLGQGLVPQDQKVRGQDPVLDLGPVQAPLNHEVQDPHPDPGLGLAHDHVQDRSLVLQQEDQDQDHRHLRPGHARHRLLQQVLAQPQINLLFEVKKNKDICITKQLVVVVKIKNCEWF